MARKGKTRKGDGRKASRSDALSHIFRIGDVARVKTNVKDPDLGMDISGWQGRVSEISPEDNMICIDWDSVTLGNTPSSVIAECEEKGLDWSKMYLEMTDVEPATARDTEARVDRVLKRLEAEHLWDSFGDEGQSIREILAGVDLDDEWEALEVWEAHLSKVLQFPFPARIAEFQEHGPLQDGDSVVVQEIVGLDDLYGVLVAVTHGRNTYDFPLCDLEATDRRSANHDLLRVYAVWFANR